ncbi:MAG: AmmeMemoRadiSam system protein A [Planctomycetaceae bacterium]|nr:AmmeMemoRadiSam system protein A [Planctomycetaceae bacterium]
MAIQEHHRQELLALARRAVEAAVRGQGLIKPPSAEGIAGEIRGCFVTLKNGPHLRGCIGTFQPRAPLGRLICEMALAAATQDPRFFHDPVTPDELPALRVEVSVLSPLELTDDPASLTVGVHGIYIVRDGYAGCFLPEVATEMGWSAREFLDNCCSHKAGLPPGAWRDGDTQVYLFTSEKFEEPQISR